MTPTARRNRVFRSLLYVPADQPTRVVKALSSTAHAVIIDLEDAVSPSSKAHGRDVVADLLPAAGVTAPPVFVRINSGEPGRTDLELVAAVADWLEGVVVAKCETSAWLDEISAALPAGMALSPLIESAVALQSLAQICGHPQVDRCHLGEIDLLADLGVATGDGDALLTHARNCMVIASVASGIVAPVAGVHPDVGNLDSLESSTRQLSALGFSGRPAIHPAQIATINAAFAPSTVDVERARRVVADYRAGERLGTGAVQDESGTMIDEAVVRRAHLTLDAAQRVENWDRPTL